MSDLSLEFGLFRYALAAADHGSFRRAAAALEVQQSSVSRGVRSLEHRVGTSLFERSHAGVRPTPAGEKFLQEAMLGFDHLERAMHRVTAVQRGEHGELTIAISVPFALLGDTVARFREKHRGVSIEMVEGTCDTGIMLVEQRKSDIAFVTRVSANGAARSLHLRDERMAAVLPKSHRLARQLETRLDELGSEMFILGAGSLGPRVAAHLKSEMSRSGAGPNLQFHRIGHCDVLNMIAWGFGITIDVGCPDHPAPLDGLVRVPLAGMHTIPVQAVWMAANPNPALKTLIKLLRKAAVGSSTRLMVDEEDQTNA